MRSGGPLPDPIPPVYSCEQTLPPSPVPDTPEVPDGDSDTE
jgi:hypothetical protein